MRTRLFVLLALALGSRTAAQAQDALPAPDTPAEPTLEEAQASLKEDPKPTQQPVQQPTQALDVDTQQPRPTAIQEEPLALGAEGPTDVAPSEATLSAAELGSLGLELSSPGLDTSLRFSGFADFTSYTPIKPRGAASTALPRHSSSTLAT